MLSDCPFNQDSDSCHSFNFAIAFNYEKDQQ